MKRMKRRMVVRLQSPYSTRGNMNGSLPLVLLPLAVQRLRAKAVGVKIPLPNRINNFWNVWNLELNPLLLFQISLPSNEHPKEIPIRPSSR